MRRAAALTFALLVLPLPALAQTQTPRFCPTNPSLESSACVTEPGRVHLEVTAIDWQLDSQPDTREDSFLLADTLLRIGVAPTTEVQLDWTPVGVVRERDRASGSVTRRGRVGDLTLAVRQNLHNPDGEGLSYGVQPFVTLPVGRTPVGAGTWSAGVIVPVTFDVTDTLNIGGTLEADAEANENGSGRHFAGNMVAAAAIDLSAAWTVTLETQILRDEEPGQASTQWVGGVGLSWTVAPTRALFAEAVAGLNHDAPDMRLYAGLATVF